MFQHLEAVRRDGFSIVPGVFTPARVDQIAGGLARALASAGCDGESIRSRQGSVYAARNVLSVFPEACELWREPPLVELLRSVLGPQAGLTRALFFDKPPDRTWSLPWHKDLTIAVEDNRLASRHYCKPTTKAGVPHVEAPLELLQRMLTLRIHLDDVTEENGPLLVMPGSHHAGKAPTSGPAHSVHVDRGDVLAMRPLVSHCSVASQPGAMQSRRILHLEFSSQRNLEDGFAWHTWVNV